MGRGRWRGGKGAQQARHLCPQRAHTPLPGANQPTNRPRPGPGAAPPVRQAHSIQGAVEAVAVVVAKQDELDAHLPASIEKRRCAVSGAAELLRRLAGRQAARGTRHPIGSLRAWQPRAQGRVASPLPRARRPSSSSLERLEGAAVGGWAARRLLFEAPGAVAVPDSHHLPADKRRAAGCDAAVRPAAVARQGRGAPSGLLLLPRCARKGPAAGLRCGLHAVDAQPCWPAQPRPAHLGRRYVHDSQLGGHSGQRSSRLPDPVKHVLGHAAPSAEGRTPLLCQPFRGSAAICCSAGCDTACHGAEAAKPCRRLGSRGAAQRVPIAQAIAPMPAAAAPPTSCRSRPRSPFRRCPAPRCGRRAPVPWSQRR